MSSTKFWKNFPKQSYIQRNSDRHRSNIMDIECTWILWQGINSRQIRLLTWTSFNGQFIHPVGGDGLKGAIVIIFLFVTWMKIKTKLPFCTKICTLYNQMWSNCSYTTLCYYLYNYGTPKPKSTLILSIIIEHTRMFIWPSPSLSHIIIVTISQIFILIPNII